MSRAATVRTPSVEFSRDRVRVTPENATGTVRRKGVIFRAGDYSHQNFSMSPDELRRVAAEFTEPILIDHGHPTADGPIDFGRLESVEVSPDGTTLYGTTATPAWLDQAIGGAKWLVSASFDRATKAIRRLSLVTRPQISDAELQAAFCACQARAGEPAAFTTTTAKESIPMGDSSTALTDEERRLLEGFRATPADERAGVLAVLEGTYVEPEPDDDEDDDEVKTPPTDPAPSPAEAAAFARIAELEAKDRRRDAEVFVDGAIKDSLVLPAERARLVARHAQFSLDDQLSPAQFSDGKALSRVAEFEADIRGRKAHGWGKDVIPGSADFAGHTLSPGGAEAETPEQRRARLDAYYAHTATGRSVLMKRNGSARV